MTSHDLEGIALALIADGKGSWRPTRLSPRSVHSASPSTLSGAGSLGNHAENMARAAPAADDPPHRRDRCDDCVP
jgi:hypothetical protein